MSIIELPSKLKKQLENDSDNKTLITHVEESLIPFLDILNENKLFFFSEYTDHGINHINGVLNSIEHLITEDSLQMLTAKDICVLVVATFLHDIGMQTNAEMFKNMIEGTYDNIDHNLFQEESWKVLWEEYIKDSFYWDYEKKNNLFGNGNHIIKEPDLNDLQSLDEYDKKFIGEFIRIHHARIAYEIGLRGYVGKGEILFNHENLPANFMQIAGLVARSHGMYLRDIFSFLIKLWGKTSWKRPLGVRIVYLMALVRLSDYLQIDSSRTNGITISLRTLFSPISQKEHNTHLAISHIELDNDDKEKIVVQANPDNAELYVKIEQLVNDIQKEFDLSWAILGEIYGGQYMLQYRRIVTNITDEEVKEGYDFIPKQFSFKSSSELSKLLIAPLYGNNPSYGVRELVQNAVDACRTRLAIDANYSKETTHVRVYLDTENQFFVIEDSGIGMSLEEIEKYFLTIGASYNTSTEWQKTRDIYSIYRTGRFGIGVLAAFLLGDQITVETKSIQNEQGYRFTFSLQDKFIQVNKIKKDDFGTRISIRCSELSYNSLLSESKQKNYKKQYSYKWYNWYRDLIPKVEYYIGDQQLRVSQNFTSLKYIYKPLNLETKHNSILYWSPISLHKTVSPFPLPFFNGPIDRTRLFINGFLITISSQKKQFNLLGLEKYYQFQFPSLYMSDVYNEIPINLQRTNIDANTTFTFEKKLVIAMYKDLLCRLLAIDFSSFIWPTHLFFNSNGFTINKSPYYPLVYKEHQLGDNFPEQYFEHYTEKFLFGKKIILLGGVDFYCMSIDKWKTLFKSCDNSFFAFHSEEFKYEYLQKGVIMAMALKRGFYESFTLALNILDILDKSQISMSDNIIKWKTWKLKFGKSLEMISGYNIYHSNNVDSGQNKSLIERVLSFFEQNNIPKPAYILIHKIKEKKIHSDVDDFFKEYDINGDMIIPYDADKRRIKYAKIYKECLDSIENYKHWYKETVTSFRSTK